MSTADNKAVFLSYASQDAEAAKRIADALRAAGVEVWFDQSELVGGDAWDTKIRKQIKECALLIPVISAATQARTEGYFRLEWRLADQRTHLMGRGRTFLLPVCIDDTKDADADVPDSFSAVQWTRAAGGEVPPAFTARVKKLLAGETVAGVADPGRPASTRPATVRGPSKWWWVLPIFGVTMALLLVLKEGRKESPPPAVPAVAAVKPPAPTTAEWPRDPELRRAMDLLNGTEANSEDFTLAEEIANRALAQHPTDPEAVTVMARTQGAFLMRGFDRSDERIALARRYGERAVQLAPDDAEALAALGSFVARSDQARAVDLLNRAIALKPAEPFFYRMRDNALFNNPQVPAADAIASAEKTAALFPRDALAHYELARHYRDLGRGADMERELDRTIAIIPIANAVVWKSRIALWVRGDPAEMKALIDRVPARVRSLERVVFSRWAYAMATGQWEEGRIALEDLTSNWIEDFDYIGPKALLAAQLLEQQGKPELARLKYEAALAELRTRQARTPGNATLRSLEVWIMHGLGRDEEALSLNRARMETVNRPYRFAQLSDWWFAAIPGCLLIGDHATALALMHEAVTPSGHTVRVRALSGGLGETGVAADTAAEARAALRMRFRFDPRMAPFRADPEIAALLAEPAGQATEGSVPIDQKSVAVLAFANLSDDKNNEYFSDGISEELLNVLAKMPGLKVTARTSSFHFKGKDTPIPEIAQQLGVAYVVEGTVRKQGDKVRITVQLIKAADGFQVWSDAFTRDLKDIFAVQDEIAGLVAQNLRAKMSIERERAALAPEVHALVLRARNAAAKRNASGFKEALELYRAALAQAPGAADIWAELAYAYQYLARFGGIDTGEGMREARLAARKALEIDPNQPLALAAFGWVQRTDDRDWRGAVQSFHRALAVAPENVTIMSDAAICFLNVGLVDEALALADHAVERDPLNPQAHWSRGILLAMSGRALPAVAAYQRSIELAPAADEYHAHLAQALTTLGRFAEARAELQQEPNERYRLSALVALLYRSGDTAAADRAMAEMIAQYGDSMKGYIAAVYARAGNRNEAFKWLERAYETRDSAVAWVKTNDFFGSLHDDPRWPVFLRKMGLADDQLK